MNEANFAEMQDWLSFYQNEFTLKELINLGQASICHMIYQTSNIKRKTLKFSDFILSKKKKDDSEEKAVSWFGAQAENLNKGFENGK